MTEKTAIEFLNERDDRVMKAINERLSSLNSEQQELEEQIRCITLQKHRITEAIKKGQWWDLAGVISANDIESLCEIETSGLEDELID